MASDAIKLEDLKKEHVLIASPVNVTVYYVSSSNIVIGWDMHPTYVLHDVIHHNLTRLEHGKEIDVGIPQVHMVAVNRSSLNETSSEETNGTTPMKNDTGTTSPAPTPAAGENEKEDSDNSVTEKAPEPEKPQSDEPAKTSETEPLVCHPATYFTNYTVAIKENPGQLDNDWATRLIDIKGDIPMANIKIKFTKKIQQKVVAFELGCLAKFRVTYQVQNMRSVAEVVDVEPHHRLANITNLKEAKTYKIIVHAVYVSNTVLSSQPVFVFTKKNEEEPVCACDWHGTVNLRNSCRVDNKGKMCQCRQGYEGQFCEECAPGFYRTAPYFPCSRCPCEEHSSRKSSCRFVEGFLYCDKCENGYAGSICHKCANGYYRQGKHCINCACNGNSDPSKEGMCKAETGECLNCLYHTTGFKCERCLPGYKGDPITHKNCTAVSGVTGPRGSGAKSGSSMSPGVIAAIVVGLLLCITVCVGLIMVKRLRVQQQRRAFWTVEMRRDKDDVDFNSVQNEEAHLDDMDDLEFYEHHGGTTNISKYSRLHEQA